MNRLGATWWLMGTTWWSVMVAMESNHHVVILIHASGSIFDSSWSLIVNFHRPAETLSSDEDGIKKGIYFENKHFVVELFVTYFGWLIGTIN